MTKDNKDEKVPYTKEEIEDPIAWLAKELKKLRKKFKKLKSSAKKLRRSIISAK